MREGVKELKEEFERQFEDEEIGGILSIAGKKASQTMVLQKKDAIENEDDQPEEIIETDE